VLRHPRGRLTPCTPAEEQEEKEYSMSSIEVKDTETGRMVRLSGELSIDQAASLKDSLLEAFEGCSELKLDMSMVESADLACLQVLCAAHRFSVRLGVRLSLSEPVPEGVVNSLKNIALYPSACDLPFEKACLWRQEAGHE
jgi:anti-anti-sigma regulatory factor